MDFADDNFFQHSIYIRITNSSYALQTGALKMQDRKMTDKSQVVKNYSTAVYPSPHPSATTSPRILFYLSI